MKKFFIQLKQLLLKGLLSLLFFTLPFNLSFGQSNSNRYIIQNLNGSVTPTALNETSFTKIARAKQAATDLFKGKYFRLIQFYEIPTTEQRKTWEKQGLKLTDYLSGNAYYAVIDNSFDFSGLSDKVRTILPVSTMFKEESKLHKMKAEKSEKITSGQLELVVSYYEGLNGEDVISLLSSLGAKIQNHRAYARQLDITINASLYDNITALPCVQFIEFQLEDPVLEKTYNHRNSSARTNFVNTGFGGLNYNGQGVTVAIGEGGILSDQIDVKGRITELASGTSSHKIGVMKNCTGGGNDDPANRNNAWGANVVSVESYPDYVSLYNTNNVRYTNHSYGIGTIPSGGYNSTARAHDLRIASYPNHLVVYSAGNSGLEIGYSPYAFLSWATITGAMKMNKNMLSVGALDQNDELKDFSSRGPMYDGRIIPQVVIEGDDGTSYAAPKVTGILTILNQIYKDKNSGIEPPSSLLRAILMNTADDLGNPGPDFKYGYGRPNVRRAYAVINNSQFITGSVDASGTNNHTINVPANTKQVRVMIVWPDAAAAVDATKGIVNDLNLLATDPSNATYNPWILNSSTPSSEVLLNTPAVRGVDNLNTIEQITVDNPSAGNWTFSVTGYAVPQGPQSYYLVYEFLQEELTMAFPLKDERFISGETYYLRWDSYGTSGTFNLSYELDGSGTWNTITTGYDATKRVYQWVAPTFTDGIHTIKFKVEKGGVSNISDINYIGAVPANFLVQLATGSTVQLYWDAVPSASAYKVYRLGNNYMGEVTSDITFNNASATLTNQSTTASEYYAVSAITNTKEGQRTMALQKVVGDIVASPRTFSAKTFSSSQINLTWTKNVVSSDVMVAYSSTADFGTPTNGTDYSVGNTISGGGTVLYKGNLTAFNHTGLTPYTRYYYKIWSVTGSYVYSIGVTDTEMTDCTSTYSLPFEENFTGVTSLPNCWKQRDNQGNGEVWQFGTTSASTYTPSLTGNYAYINSYSGTNNLRDAELISPTFDLTNNLNIILSFNHHYVSTIATTAKVFYSTDNGSTWTLLQSFGATSNPTYYTSGVIKALEGKSQVKFKWTYTSTGWTFYWAIDDIKIIDGTNYWTGATDTDWFTATNWSTGAVPTVTSAVIIPSAPSNQPQINAAGAVCSDITINSGASLTMNGTTAYTLSVTGDWTNNGTFNRGIGTVDFNGTGDLQQIKGSSTTAFNILKVTKGAQSKILEATSLITLNAASNPLVLTSGTFKLSSASTIVPFTDATGAAILTATGLWNNGGIINSGAFEWIINGGLIRVSAGTINIGTAAGNSLQYHNNGNLFIEGGAINIAARFMGNGTSSTAVYTQTGGTLTLFTVGSSSTTRAPFEINTVVNFNMSGGTIVIPKGSSNTAGEYVNLSITNNVTGGTLQIGNASTAASQTIRINSTVPIYNLLVNSTNSPTAQLVTNGLTVKNDVTIGSGAKIDANSLNLSVGGNWVNNGGSLTATPTGTVTFNGTSAQSISGSAATTFNNLTLNNSNGLILGGSVNAAVNGVLNFTSGVITTGTNKIIIGSTGSVTRTSGHVFGNLQKNVATGTNVNRTFEIGDASSANYTPATLNFASVSTAGDLVVKTISGDHPSIASSNLIATKSVNRYWTLTNSGVGFTTYDGIFTFLSSDLDGSANTNNLSIGTYSASTWSYPTVGTKTAISTQMTGLSTFGDFQLGEMYSKISLATGGNWNNTGTWTEGALPTASDNVLIKSTGTVTVNITDAICNDIAIQSGGVLQIAPAKALTVNGTFTNNAGNAGFVLQSDDNGTGTFVDNVTTPNTSVGATVQQYLPAVRNWYMSTPVDGATAPSGNIYYRYIEAGNNGSTWTPVTSGSGFVPLAGYIVVPSVAASPIEFSGTLNTGNQSITDLTSTATAKTGFNLVGNPYPSYVDWMSATKTNLSTTIWYRTRNAETTPAYVFDTYNETPNIGTNNNGIGAVTAMIPPMQAFWVRVDANKTGSLSFSNAIRSHREVSTNNFRAPAVKNATNQILRLQLTNGTYSDETVVYFNANASGGFNNYDSPKMFNGNTSAISEIYTAEGTEKLVINGMSTIPYNTEIPLYFNVNASKAASFTLTATELSNFEQGTSVVIKNNKTGELQLISDGSDYTFNPAEATNNPAFSIIIKAPGTITDFSNPDNHGLYLYGNENKQIVVTLNQGGSGNAMISVFNAIGQKISEKQITKDKMLIDVYTPGVYLVAIHSDGKTITEKVIVK